MKHFVLDYDQASCKLVRIEPFTDMRQAVAEYAKRERDSHGTAHEIVLLGAECEDDLHQTHARYFFGIAQMANRTLSRYRTHLSEPL